MNFDAQQNFDSLKEQLATTRKMLEDQANRVKNYYREKTMAVGQEGTMEQISIGEANRKYASVFKLMITGPFIWAMIVPLFILDIGIEIYQHVCFPLYGIKLVPRSRYIRIDRHRLSYLDGLSKLNCLYCSYANGLLHYASVIAASTELYWCPIQQRAEGGFNPPAHHEKFAKYDDIQSLKTVLEKDRTDPSHIEQ